mmetsp:Transcript_43473/g.31297  ORF Transcript_43473/g.31297 Transcript_43473/m.31297 type:complete len:99 (+) Transcript_43473:445-741(+)
MIETMKKTSVYNYSDKQSTFLKIYVAQPRFVAQLRGIFEKGFDSSHQDDDNFSRTTYESNMPFALRFMIDNDIGGMTWIRIEPGNYIVRQGNCKMTTC